MNIKLSLIVPVYNAELFIIDTLVRLDAWQLQIGYSVEIIIVNDGSTDLTLSIINNYFKTKKSAIKIISYKLNQGKGYAIKKGMLAAMGDFRIFTDADIPFGFEAIANVLYYLDFKEFDICIGNRKSMYSKYFVKMSLLRKLSSKLFTIIISRYIVTGVNDTQCGLKGFRADAADKLFSKLRIKSFAFDVELLYLSYKYEYDIKRLPVTFEGNNFSTISLAKDSIHMLWDIICLPFNFHFSKKY